MMPIERRILERTKTDPNLPRLVRVAQEFRDRAVTHGTSVGIAYEMYDGRMFGAFNIEKSDHDSTHAETVGIYSFLLQGYIGTDVKRMAEIYQNSGHDAQEYFPACPKCWRDMYDFTHPYLEIVVASVEGKMLGSLFLKDVFGLKPPMQVYPSNRIKEIKARKNSKPKLPLAPELAELCRADKDFDDLCKRVLRVDSR